MEIPEGYKWIFVHERWTPIPSVNTDKFYSQKPSPLINSIEDLNDDELLDWEEDEDFLGDEFAKEDQFLEEENFSNLENDQYSIEMNKDHSIDPVPDHSEKDRESENREPEAARMEVVIPDLHSSEIQHSGPSSLSNALRQIRRSDRPKKSLCCWNEKLGFFNIL